MPAGIAQSQGAWRRELLARARALRLSAPPQPACPGPHLVACVQGVSWPLLWARPCLGSPTPTAMVAGMFMQLDQRLRAIL